MGKPVAAIVGLGDSYADKENRKDPLQLAAEALTAAVADAGIDKSEVDVLLTGRSPWADKRSQWSNIFISYMQMPLTFTSEMTLHGAGLTGSLGVASEMIRAGRAKYVVCLQSDATELFVDAVAMGSEADADPQYEVPYGPTIPSLYGQAAHRYMHEFGVTEEDLAHVAVANQSWGAHHPRAVKGRYGEIDVEKVLSSPYIASPLRLWMCSRWGGGTGGAVVLTSPDNVKPGQDAVYLQGYGTATTHEYLTDRVNMTNLRFADMGQTPNLSYTATVEAARQAYAMSGLTPADVDIRELSVNFAHMGPIILEDLGFAAKGRGVELYKEGRTLADGDLPTDTNGGWLSFGQPGISCNMDTIVETVRQLRGTALGAAPATAPEVALVQGAGGMLAAAAVLLLTNAA
ncbi:thiolase family protein [Gordonia sp. X0973]|uniref:thiolase family protein n=1 Tax=Gordonia sp. X0973 TaxID=2742602 RepID=UPI000F542D33|nr:thiolase family protein [Gordonia sp. X0973]QKT07332.1 thiolase family protein [Gordonia sp. X0973]